MSIAYFILHAFVLASFLARELYDSIPPSRKVPMPLAPSTAAFKCQKIRKRNNLKTEQTQHQKTTEKPVQGATSFLALLERHRIPPCLTWLRCNASDATSTAWRRARVQGRSRDLRARCLSASDLRRDADEDEVCLPLTAAMQPTTLSEKTPKKTTKKQRTRQVNHQAVFERC